MDMYSFYREATLRICGNLEIEEALVSSLNFLRQEMPVDSMLLELFEDAYPVVLILEKRDIGYDY